MNIVGVIAQLTFREAIRRKIVLAALILGTLFLILYGVGFYFIQHGYNGPAHIRTVPQAERFKQEAFNFIILAGMYAVNFLGIATAALISADSLAGEIQSGTIQAIATKPIRRTAVVLGKWLGHTLLLALYLIMMGGGVNLIVWMFSGYSAPNWTSGLGLVFFNSLIIMTLSMAFSSSLSTMATGGAVFGAYGVAFLGGWVERIGGILQNQTTTNLGIFSSLLLPTEALWNKAASQMTSPLASLIGATPFSSASEPSPLMIVYSGVYFIVLLAIAIRQFNKRDL
jgi:Cu-processing system permease protein